MAGGRRPLINDRIRELTALKPGDVFDKSKVQEIAEGVRRLYLSSGYPEATVTPKIKILAPGRVLLEFLVVEGPVSETK